MGNLCLDDVLAMILLSIAILEKKNSSMKGVHEEQVTVLNGVFHHSLHRTTIVGPKRCSRAQYEFAYHLKRS